VGFRFDFVRKAHPIKKAQEGRPLTQQQLLAAPLSPAQPSPADPRYFPSAFDQFLTSKVYGINDDTYRHYMRSDIERGREIARVLSPWSSLQRKDVLDIGCGYGGLLIVMKEAGAKTISGIEIDQERLDWAALRLGALDHPAELLRLDICDQKSLPQLGLFDVILAQDILEHVLDPVAAIRNISALLRPGGVVYVQVGNKFSPDQLLADHHYKLPGITMLSRAQAIDYWQIRGGRDPSEYGVGYWREEKYYRHVCSRAGVKLHRTDHFSSPDEILWYAEAISQVCKLLDGNPWPDVRPALARRMHRRMRKIVELYVHASRQLPSIESQPDLVAQACDAIVGRLLTGVWRLVGVKEPGSSSQ